MEEMNEMYTIELIKCASDGSITCSEVVDAYGDDEQALNYAWDQVSSWYNKDWDHVLVNDPDGCCIFSVEPDYQPDGSERFKWVDHYDWITDIYTALDNARENTGVAAEIESFCYTDTYNNLVRPFEPVGGNKKRVNRKEYENMLDDLQEFFESGLEDYKED